MPWYSFSTLLICSLSSGLRLSRSKCNSCCSEKSLELALPPESKTGSFISTSICCKQPTFVPLYNFTVSTPGFMICMGTVCSLGFTRTLATKTPFSAKSKLGSKMLSEIIGFLIRAVCTISCLPGISMSSLKTTTVGSFKAASNTNNG